MLDEKTIMALSLEQEYMEMPIITKAYITACVLTTTAVVSFDTFERHLCEFVFSYELHWNVAIIIFILFVFHMATQFLNNCDAFIFDFSFAFKTI